MRILFEHFGVRDSLHRERHSRLRVRGGCTLVTLATDLVTGKFRAYRNTPRIPFLAHVNLTAHNLWPIDNNQDHQETQCSHTQEQRRLFEALSHRDANGSLLFRIWLLCVGDWSTSGTCRVVLLFLFILYCLENLALAICILPATCPTVRTCKCEVHFRGGGGHAD